jgi:protein SCO1
MCPTVVYRRCASIAAIIPLLLALALLGACSRPEPPQLDQATLLPSAKPLLAFELVDHQGKPFTQDSLKGRWSFAFFGYTHCPDVCPMALSMLAQVQRTLEKNAAAGALPQVLFVSVDPERDTPQLLAKFVPYFHASFNGVTGDPQQLQVLTRQLGILYGKAEPAATENYLVDHSAAIILFDPDAKFHALFNVPHDPALIASDFIAIRQYYEAIR